MSQLIARTLNCFGCYGLNLPASKLYLMPMSKSLAKRWKVSNLMRSLQCTLSRTGNAQAQATLSHTKFKYPRSWQLLKPTLIDAVVYLMHEIVAVRTPPAQWNR